MKVEAHIQGVGGQSIDDEFPALPVINYDHFMVHEHKAFTATVSNAVTNINEQTAIAFNVPSGYEIHVVFTAESPYNATFYLYQNPSVDVDEGTALVPVNRYQNASPTASVLTSIETTPVVNRITWYNETQAASAGITTTTQIDTMTVLGGKGPQAVGGVTRGTEEWVLKGPQQYCAVLNAETNDDATHKLRMDWYEVAD
jgi:hypothetical protein